MLEDAQDGDTPKPSIIELIITKVLELMAPELEALHDVNRQEIADLKNQLADQKKKLEGESRARTEAEQKLAPLEKEVEMLRRQLEDAKKESEDAQKAAVEAKIKEIGSEVQGLETELEQCAPDSSSQEHRLDQISQRSRELMDQLFDIRSLPSASVGVELSGEIDALLVTLKDLQDRSQGPLMRVFCWPL